MPAGNCSAFSNDVFSFDCGFRTDFSSLVEQGKGSLQGIVYLKVAIAFGLHGALTEGTEGVQ